MQELVGRLTALDPQASASLKVIAYFDALVDGHAGPEVLLRGAAVLSGCAAGVASGVTCLRVDASGVRRGPAVVPMLGSWPEHPVAAGGRAWIEREGRAHANDAMILERLAIGLSIAFERMAPATAAWRAVDTVIDPSESLEHRMSAAVRMRIDGGHRLRVVAQPAREPVGEGRHSTVVVTPVGAIRAIIGTAAEPGFHEPSRAGCTNGARAGGTNASTTSARRAGLGTVGDAANLGRSWTSALLALRLTSDARPVLDADELGGVVLIAEAADARAEPHPDRAALERVLRRDGRALALLESLLATDSLRGAAGELGLHHSTLQARVAELSSALGYDIRRPDGRTRLSLALSLHLLATNRFE
jgi:hypothetical protein